MIGKTSITTTSKIEYKLTVFHIKVEVPQTKLGFEENDAVLNEIFETALRGFDLGIEYKPTSTLEVAQIGFSEYHHFDKCWTRQYTVKVTEPIG